LNQLNHAVGVGHFVAHSDLDGTKRACRRQHAGKSHLHANIGVKSRLGAGRFLPEAADRGGDACQDSKGEKGTDTEEGSGT